MGSSAARVMRRGSLAPELPSRPGWEAPPSIFCKTLHCSSAVPAWL